MVWSISLCAAKLNNVLLVVPRLNNSTSFVLSKDLCYLRSLILSQWIVAILILYQNPIIYHVRKGFECALRSIQQAACAC